MRIQGCCEVCEAPTDLGICRRCERAMDEAAARDRAKGITFRCRKCGGINGEHAEGQCGSWRDDYGWED